MPTTLDPAPTHADCDAETAESRDVVLVGEIGELKPLDTRTDFDGRSRPAWTFVGRDVFHVFEPVHPHAEGSCPRRLAQKIVTGVLDHEADASVSRKVHGKLYLRNIGGFHGVRWISTLSAALGVQEGRRLACKANLMWAHDFDWIVASVRLLASAYV